MTLLKLLANPTVSIRHIYPKYRQLRDIKIIDYKNLSSNLRRIQIGSATQVMLSMQIRATVDQKPSSIKGVNRSHGHPRGRCVRDLPILDRPVTFLRLPIRRFKCSDCLKVRVSRP